MTFLKNLPLPCGSILLLEKIPGEKAKKTQEVYSELLSDFSKSCGQKSPGELFSKFKKFQKSSPKLQNLPISLKTRLDLLIFLKYALNLGNNQTPFKISDLLKNAEMQYPKEGICEACRLMLLDFVRQQIDPLILKK